MKQRLLDDISGILHSDAWNYTVFLQAYEVFFSQPSETAAIIEMALGPKAVLGGVERVGEAEVWPAVMENVLYAGDKGAGPSDASIKSEAMGTLIRSLGNEVEALITTASSIESFWLEEGHPAYPVFWDFAFLFKRGASATVLIGSSSD